MQGAWFWDASTDEFHCNRQMVLATGAKTAEECSARLREAIAAIEDHERLQLVAAVACEERFELEIAIPAGSVRARALRVRGHGELDRRGHFIGAAGIAHDLGEFDDVSGVEEQYRFIVTTSAREAVWDWNLDSGDAYWNDRLIELVGLDRQEFEQLEGAHVLFHPDDVPAMNAAKERHYRGETSMYEVEHRLLHKSGRYVPVLTRGRAQLDDSGVPRRMVGLVYDLTAEREPLEAEQRLRFALDATSSGMWHYDAQLKRLYWTDQLRDLLGYDRLAEPSLDWLFTRLSPDEAEHLRALSSQRLPELFEQEFDFADASGRTRRLLCRGHARYSNGTLEAVAGVIQDVSDLRRLQSERDQLRRGLRDRLAQELAASSLCAEAVQRSGISDEERGELLAAIGSHLEQAREELHELMLELRPLARAADVPLARRLDALVVSSVAAVEVDIDLGDTELDLDIVEAVHLIVAEAVQTAEANTALTVAVRSGVGGSCIVVISAENADEEAYPVRGLSAMRAHVDRVGGTLEICPGSTRVKATLPCGQREQDRRLK